jgi:hypothetical protein
VSIPSLLWEFTPTAMMAFLKLQRFGTLAIYIGSTTLDRQQFVEGRTVQILKKFTRTVGTLFVMSALKIEPSQAI